MKKALICLVFFVILSANTVLSADYQIVGGYYYLDLDPDMNDYISNYNEYLLNSIDTSESFGYTFHSKKVNSLDEIKDANGYYIGISTKLNSLIPKIKDDLFITAQYERFSDEDTASVHTVWTDNDGNDGTTQIEINNGIKVHGIYTEVSKRLNNYLELTGGVGYYKGEANNNYSVDITDSTDIKRNHDTDLEGSLGLKVGSNLTYPLTDALNFSCNLSYRCLTMDLEDKITDTYYDGDVTISELDLDGFETKLGFTYKF